MPLQATSGAASYDAFGGGVPVVPNYIEEVFQTWLYTGTGSAISINNGIDLSTNGGLVWIKNRTGAQSHNLYDTARGRAYRLASQSTAAQTGPSGSTNDLTSFNTNGFSLGTEQYSNTNDSAFTYASWTFRKQPKFFDVVTLTYTSGAAVFNHSLGSTPGFVIVKVFDGYADNWWVYHRSLGNDQYLSLDLTSQAQTSTGIFSATSTTFTVKNGIFGPSSIVAYLYAHDAGGFGLTGTDNVISCGSFASNNGTVVNLGYEPQWLLYQDATAGGNWRIADTMRGFTNLSGANAYTIKQLRPNSTGVESDNSGPVLTSTGFTWNQSGGGNTIVYVAIRRGPMKVPTVGTSVFLPTARTGTGTNTTITTGFVNDSVWSSQRAGGYRGVFDRLRGANILLFQNVTGAESTYTDTLTGFDNNTGINVGVDSSWGGINLSGASDITYSFQRAPSFFDEVCVTGTGAGATYNHNLGVVPEFMIQHGRSLATDWETFTPLGVNTAGPFLNKTNAASASSGYWTAPTATTFKLQSSIDVAGNTYVAYLFATCAGVSKVGSYTGNGTTQTIDCGFGAGGARFVLIKRTDDVGGWYVYDTARGMTTLTDPYLFLNTTAAEVATLGSVTTVSTGFALNSTILAAINVNGGTYIFLAIA
jgi:hypothetical protein